MSAPCGLKWKMWSRVVVVFSCLFTANYILSQPLKDESDKLRSTRQLDFGECCPCPDPGLYNVRNREALQSLPPRADDVDDCPCRYRAADSDGSSSLLFPTATRPFMKQDDEKEEPKNLLEPEVNLASSVLETLREVTEEEYQVALARDAARTKTAEESLLKDAIPEESGLNTVTIIVNPRQSEGEDVVSDASHLQESRCIHPLGRSLNRIRMRPVDSINMMDEILKLPKKRPVGLLHRNLLDMDSHSGASSILESVVDPMKKIIPTSQGRMTDESSMTVESPISTQTNQANPMANNKDDDFCDDSGFASSNMQDRFAEKQNPKLQLKSLTTIDKLLDFKESKPLKNIFKLRDVEFIRPGNKNEFKPLISRHVKNPLDLNELFNSLQLSFRKNSISKNVEKPLKTEILDSLPNTSNAISKQTNNNNCDLENKSSDLNVAATHIDEDTTDLPDSIISPSANVPILFNNDDRSQGDLKENDSNNNFQNECITENTNISLQPKSKNIELASNEQNENNVEFMNSLSEQQDFPDNKIIISEDIRHLNDLQSDEDSLLSLNKFNNFITQPIDYINDDESFLSKTSNAKDTSEDIDDSVIPIEKLLSSNVTSNVTSRSSKKLESLKENFENKTIKMTGKSSQLKSKILRLNDDDKSTENVYTSEKKSVSDEDNLDNNGAEIRNKDDIKEEKGNPMSITDLQKLSNSLLKLSNKLEKEATTKDVITKGNIIDLNKNGEKFESKNVPGNSNTDDVMQLTPRNNGIEDENKNSSDLDSKIKDNKNKFKLLAKENLNEMDTGASEPVISKILKSPELHKGNNAIVEPSSLEDYPNVDNNNIFSTLPTLDDIKDQLSGIFGINNINNNEDNSSKGVAETCPIDDNEDEESLMSAEPSTLNTRLVPSEDMNLELFQWKPLGAEPDILKSFRAKLHLPKNLKIKPMKLQSTVGNKNSFLGTTLLVDSKQKPKSRLNSKSIFNDDRTNVFKIPRGNILNLDDFTSTLKDNAQNLLNRGRELVPYNLEALPSIETLTENLRTHAESAAKNLQQNVESTLKHRRPNNFFNKHLSTPNEILERIASAREDFNDKIVGLHHDLNDRLTTLHENIFDQSRFMSSRIPIIKSRDNSPKNNVQNLRKTKTKPLKLLTAESMAEPVEMINHGWNKNFDKDGDLLNDNTRVEQERTRLRPYKSASNIPVPKYVEVPKLEQTLNKPPTLSQARFKTNNLEPIIKTEKQSFNTKYGPLLRKEVNPFKDSKFKITFATTTQAPTTPMPKSNILTLPSSRLRSSLDKERNSDFITNRATSRIPKLKSYDTNVLPSKHQVSKVPAPTNLLAANSECLEIDKFKSAKAKQYLTPHSTRHSVNSNEADSTDISRSLEDENDEHKRGIQSWQAINRPKKVNDSFLTQVREAVKSRKADVDPNKDFRSSNGLLDMAKSATENKDTSLIDKHLKENVTYKCKMICSRE